MLLPCSSGLTSIVTLVWAVAECMPAGWRFLLVPSLLLVLFMAIAGLWSVYKELRGCNEGEERLRRSLEEAAKAALALIKSVYPTTDEKLFTALLDG